MNTYTWTYRGHKFEAIFPDDKYSELCHYLAQKNDKDKIPVGRHEKMVELIIGFCDRNNIVYTFTNESTGNSITNRSRTMQIRDTLEIECEICDYEGPDCKVVDGIVHCPMCLQVAKDKLATKQEKEKKAILESKLPEQHNRRYTDHVLATSDFHTKVTESIVARRKRIDANEKITDKNWEECQIVKDLVLQRRDTIARKNLEMQELQVEVNAHVARLNQLASTLREDQREQLKLKDINYPASPIKKVSAPRIKKEKSDTPKSTSSAFTQQLKEAVTFGVSKGILVAGTSAEISLRGIALQQKTDPMGALKYLAGMMGKSL